VLPLVRHAGFFVAVATSAVMNTVRLEQNGYSNIFYSAAVKSMLRSLHNFVFVSFDPGGLITVDKPPLALWVQAASAKLFGFTPLSLLLPGALIGVLTVAVLYVVLARRFGPFAAFVGAFVLAVFPSFVAVSRDNGVDPELILLMLLACGAAIRACETGRWRTLVLSGAMIGLAFNVKTLAAYLVVPGIAAGILVCAPGTLARRALGVLVVAVATLGVSAAWIAFVELTPASQRPYVGSSTNNTELGLTFEYNGLGRVEGQVGGPNSVHGRAGARVPPPPAARPRRRPPSAGAGLADGASGAQTGAAAGSSPRRATGRALSHGAAHAPQPRLYSTYLPNGRLRYPVPFGGSPSPVRLFGKGLGDQGGWTVPIAVFGLVALMRLAWVVRRRRPASGDDATPAHGVGTDDESEAPAAGRRDPRLATLIVLGGWFVVEAGVLSLSKGIVHPYYVSALAPGVGAMAGAGAVALIALRRGASPNWGLALIALTAVGTVAVQILLLHREEYLQWFVPFLVAGATAAVLFAAVRRGLARPAVVLLLCVLLVAPTAYATTTWLAPVEGTFPAAGPKAAAGDGGYGIGGRSLQLSRAIVDYVRTHRPGSPYALLAVAANSAAPYVLLGLKAASVGGYSGTDPALDARGLARMVERRQARYVLLGGIYSSRGGNRATAATLHACRLLAPAEWKSPLAYPNGLALFDCGGRARALRATEPGGRAPQP
jgi:4-amino-4-deoxy-L-arabinose transferase-like glycosyltransferase